MNAQFPAPQSNGLPPPLRTPLLVGSNPDAKRTEILNYFCKTFDLYASLFDCIADERGWFSRAIPIRHPLIFYFGHTAAFFINKLIAASLISKRIDPDIEALVAIGVDEMSWDDLNDRHYDWPTVPKMSAYRSKVKERVIDFINIMPITLPIDWDSPAWTILMGIEHERIHLETSSVLIRQLPIEWVHPQAHWPTCPHARLELSSVPKNVLAPVPGREITLGKHDHTYGWDNEYGERRFQVAPFEATRMLVCNAEFLDFVLANGYQERKWWSDEGWAWRDYAKARMPTFWVGSPEGADKLQLRLMTQWVPMPWDWPVEVNYLEAAAFCRWKAEQLGRPVQLISEAEWMCLRSKIESDEPDWIHAPGNIDLDYWASSCPVDLFGHGEFFDVIGNVWEWTSTPIDGYPGFKVHPLYDDFSTPTFDGKHNLIKGGSWISTGNEALISSRYAFRRHFFQHAGLRYVVSTFKERSITNPYETDQLVSQYLDLHYGAEHFGVPNFPKALAEIANNICPSGERALDIGCAVGRASFELAKHFKYVDAVDFSARFIDVALQLAAEDRFRYVMPTEGELVNYCEARLSTCQIGRREIERTHFSQGDALNLKPKYKEYDLVLAANLIDRLQNPAHFLTLIQHRMKPGAILVLCSPYTWLSEYTPKENWLGGIHENGEAVPSYRALQRILVPHFDEIAPPQDIPLVIPETGRKFQHIMTQLTLWRLRS